MIDLLDYGMYFSITEQIVMCFSIAEQNWHDNGYIK